MHLCQFHQNRIFTFREITTSAANEPTSKQTIYGGGNYVRRPIREKIEN